MSANRRRLIHFIEYATVSAAVVGAITTLTTRQPAYAIAPLSVAAALNLVSRHQQAQSVEEHGAYLDQQVQTFASALQQIQQRLEIIGQQGLNRQQSLEVLQQSLEALQQSLESLTQTVSEQAATLTTTAQQSETARDELSQQWEMTRGELSQQWETARDELAQQKAVCDELLQQLETVHGELKQQQQALSTFASLTQVDELSRTLQQTKMLIGDEIEGIQVAQKTLAIQTEATLGQQQERLDRARQRFERQKGRLEETRQHLEEQQTSSAEQATLLESHFVSLYSDFEALKRELELLVLRVDELPNSDRVIDVPDFSQVAPQLPDGDNFDLDINLGIDFGTGYTKVCFRDLARDRSEVVTFAAPSTSGLTLDQTLMPTRLAILQDGTLLTGLTMAEWQQCDRPIRQEINYIKMRLAAIDLHQAHTEDEWRLERIPELDDEATVESLCAYYLSSVIQRSQQWITQNRPDLFANQTVRWSVNIGVPVEYCDSPALERFERVLALAWLLKSTTIDTSTLTIGTLNRLIAHLQQWMVDNNAREALDCYTTPEIVAAVWSFLSSREAQDGFYTFFDIGDGTLDGAAFRFERAADARKVDCYVSEVQPLGVTAFAQQAADELNSSPELILEALATHTDSNIKNKIENSDIRRTVQKLVARVVFDGKEQHIKARKFSASDEIGTNLNVFVGGGGSNTTFFPNTIYATHEDFQHGNSDIPPYQIRHMPPPKDLSINGVDPKDFNRFAVAYGLCIPEGEGPTIQLPSQLQNIESTTEIELHKPAPYEDGKDAM